MKIETLNGVSGLSKNQPHSDFSDRSIIWRTKDQNRIIIAYGRIAAYNYTTYHLQIIYPKTKKEIWFHTEIYADEMELNSLWVNYFKNKKGMDPFYARSVMFKKTDVVKTNKKVASFLREHGIKRGLKNRGRFKDKRHIRRNRHDVSWIFNQVKEDNKGKESNRMDSFGVQGTEEGRGHNSDDAGRKAYNTQYWNR